MKKLYEDILLEVKKDGVGELKVELHAVGQKENDGN